MSTPTMLLAMLLGPCRSGIRSAVSGFETPVDLYWVLTLVGSQQRCPHSPHRKQAKKAGSHSASQSQTRESSVETERCTLSFIGGTCLARDWADVVIRRSSSRALIRLFQVGRAGGDRGLAG
ncbi:hypothetical protein F4824DRAFT_16566 [Ustulina deusta]|nr:hypothetical protein F4824DRAFT_16566 [Ustulina deusta]